MHLDSTVVPCSEISPQLFHEMLALMQASYDGVSRESFEADFRRKQWVILLYHSGRLCGFSTQVLAVHQVNDVPVRILFSGDTIIDPRYWGSLALPVAFARLGLALQAKDPGSPLYWLLISKGYKTYRYLPIFYNDFYPRHDLATPVWEKQVIDQVAQARFGSRYDSFSGCIRGCPGSQRLRPGVADIEDRRLADPHIAFFLKVNPNHAAGDELVCIARLQRDNFTNFLRRLIDQTPETTSACPPL